MLLRLSWRLRLLLALVLLLSGRRRLGDEGGGDIGSALELRLRERMLGRSPSSLPAKPGGGPSGERISSAAACWNEGGWKAEDAATSSAAEIHCSARCQQWLRR